MNEKSLEMLKEELEWRVLMEQWVVEYSVRQDCCHVTQLQDALKTNSRTSLNLQDNDYRIVSIHKTQDEALKSADMFKKVIEVKKMQD